MLPKPSDRTLSMQPLIAAALTLVLTWPVCGEDRRPWNFENDIVPILTRFQCNMSGCHGKAEGQAGFKLSVFGFDPEADYAAIAHESRNRRVFPAAPEFSLLLRKAAGQIPHGGGKRIDPAQVEYGRLRDWIADGMPFGTATDARLLSIVVQPSERQMTMGQQQQLTVTAVWSDGRQEDVTPLATFQTNNEALATVDEDGQVQIGQVPGTVAIMAGYLGKVDVFEALIPHAEPLAADAKQHLQAIVESAHVIDQPVAERLLQLQIAAAPDCDDATWFRRVSLDLLGTLPTASETRQFLSNIDPQRRAHAVDSFLQRPEFSDYWAMKWADLLRVNRRTLGRKGAQAYYGWIHRSISDNLPLDQFARQLLTASGPLHSTPAAYFYKSVSDPHEMVNSVSQVFLGIRMECARCHHHPWDRWGQTDYHGMQAFFTQVQFKSSGGGQSLVTTATTETRHPRTSQLIHAHALDQPMPDVTPIGDRRELLAEWITSPRNPWFAANLSNRIWAHFMGRGLVEPVDDFRLTNPPTNPRLLQSLSQHLTTVQFDLRQFVRTIVLSETYQRSTQPLPSNAADEQNYSRYPMKRLDAEVLLDAVSQTTGVPEIFPGMPAGTRAIQVWDSHLPHQFLELFGRPVRETACECERVSEPTVAQVLHVLNSPQIESRLRHADGLLARLIDRVPDPEELVDELYLTFYGRYPASEERAVAVKHLEQNSQRTEAVEDLAWSLLNSPEFLLNH